MDLVVREQVSLSTLTTLKTGGYAQYVITVTSLDELKAAVVFAQQKQLLFFVVGCGSNLLAPDEGYSGVIILMRITGRQYQVMENSAGVVATFGAGEILDEVIADTVERGYWGLENLSHIPGTVGATPVQNVGAYGVEVAHFIDSVTVFDTELMESKRLTNSECVFTYRDSLFKNPAYHHYIILDVSFILRTSPQPHIQYKDLLQIFIDSVPTQAAIRDAVISIRSKKFPDWNVLGTAGSFFKNPIVPAVIAEELGRRYPELPMYPDQEGMVKLSLGYILDRVCGLKGYRIGPVRLYEEQALVLVAEHSATTVDIEKFVSAVASVVFEKSNVHIEREVTDIT